MLDQYLIANLGSLRFGLYCRDVRNVHTDQFKLVRSHDDASFSLGMTVIGGHLAQVIDLRKRIGFPSVSRQNDAKTIISFNMAGNKVVGLVVDQVEGMRHLPNERCVTNSGHLNMARSNIDLLFPKIAVLPSGEMIYLLDSTYIEKTEAIEEDSGELEFF